METLYAMDSLAILSLSWSCITLRFSRLWMAPALAVASAVPLALAARIEALRRRCTVPVEGVLVDRELCDAKPFIRVRDTWRYPWGDDVRFVVDVVPVLTLWHEPIREVGRTATLWVDPSRPPDALSAGALPRAGAASSPVASRLRSPPLVVSLMAATCAGWVTWRAVGLAPLARARYDGVCRGRPCPRAPPQSRPRDSPPRRGGGKPGATMRTRASSPRLCGSGTPSPAPDPGRVV